MSRPSRPEPDAMQRLLLITSEPAHLLLYRPRLSREFSVELSSSVPDGLSGVDAIVYDIPAAPSAADFQ